MRILGCLRKSVDQFWCRKPPIENKTWIKLIEECVDLYDELDQALEDFDEPRREIAAHVCNRIAEILLRSGVETIESDTTFDRSLHQPIKKTAGVAPGDPRWRAHVVSPGFRVNRHVMRRARVEVIRVEVNETNAGANQEG
jgi:molecular chaperone GrpE (heat shock protein)